MTRSAVMPQARGMISMDDPAAQFTAPPGYLNTAAAGLPPQAAVKAIERHLADWSGGRVRPERYDDAVRRARAAFARIARVDPDRVAVGSQVSVGVSLFADWVPDGAEVLCAAGDFSSMVFPFLAQGDRIRVRHVPVAELAGEVRTETALVSFSLVQSAHGEIAESAAIAAAARAVGANTLCDLTQAAGWLPVEATQFGATVCAAYEWLCAPRGASFVTVAAELGAELHAVHAGWYAGENVGESCYGPQMTLAESARPFDVSPAWSCWVGSAIVSLPDPDGSRRATLDVAGVRVLDVGRVPSVRAFAGR